MNDIPIDELIRAKRARFMTRRSIDIYQMPASPQLRITADALCRVVDTLGGLSDADKAYLKDSIKTLGPRFKGQLMDMNIVIDDTLQEDFIIEAKG